MLKFSPLFVQKIFCFVQIPKVLVQNKPTTTGEKPKKKKASFRKNRKTMGNTVKPSLLNHLIVFINEQQPNKGTFSTTHPNHTDSMKSQTSQNKML